MTATKPEARVALAPGSIVVIRDEEWLVRATEETADGTLVHVQGPPAHLRHPRVVLGRYGVAIVGRSQRLTLNYRTTAQNLRYVMGVLEGGQYVDLEDQPEATGYRSARPDRRIR